MSRLIALDFDENELPRDATVKLSLAELVALADILGKLSHQNGGSPESSSVYDLATGSVLNRFFDDGLTEARHYLAENDR